MIQRDCSKENGKIPCLYAQTLQSKNWDFVEGFNSSNFNTSFICVSLCEKVGLGLQSKYDEDFLVMTLEIKAAFSPYFHLRCQYM